MLGGLHQISQLLKQQQRDGEKWLKRMQLLEIGDNNKRKILDNHFKHKVMPTISQEDQRNVLTVMERDICPGIVQNQRKKESQ